MPAYGERAPARAIFRRRGAQALASAVADDLVDFYALGDIAGEALVPTLLAIGASW